MFINIINNNINLHNLIFKINKNNYKQLKLKIMLVLKGHQTQYPLEFAVAKNGNSKLGYSKGGFPLNQNGMPMDKTGRNALKKIKLFINLKNKCYGTV